jgi:hypothetical protein
MTPVIVVASAARAAVELYFRPIRWLWSRATADYRDIAAADFFWELHSLASAIAEGRLSYQLVQVAVPVLNEVEAVLVSGMAHTLDLSSLATLLPALAETADDEAHTKIAVHAAFIAGYVAGMLNADVLAHQCVHMVNTFYECHKRLVRLNKQLRRRSQVDAA